MTTTLTTSPSRTWALCGALGGLIGLVGLLVGADLTGGVGDGIKDSALVVAEIAGKRNYVWLYQVVSAASAGLIVVFAAGLRRHLAAQEPAGSLVPGVAGTGLGLVAAVLLVGGGMSTELYWALGEPERWDPDTIAAMVEIYNTIAWVWTGAGVAALAVAIGGFRHGSVAKWLAAVSAVLAVLVFATQAYPAQYAALFAGALWVIVAGLAFTFGGRRPAATA
ncbi:hypothetical protein KZZ52_28450 [Dactylosporangium sp. AC04546]|uniref:hypothetical protein n=1 Tax=Dactylosporangium sp. AC04546 TaxID=2862460 RepID=UPI001EDDD172|nr:hypothetical protein [Dactylosporangium sp. AC04546]WVK89201.1 hypothetical protein KZZ52_28450 [Dactylosporangium sp. AC04546]